MNLDNVCLEDPLEENHRARSNFTRQVVQHFGKHLDVQAAYLDTPPRRIVQFWNDLDQLPNDVKECIHSWRELERQGFEILMFDASSAKEFIRTHLGSRYERAFEKCYHPAMQSDYFRLCYIFMQGGCYIDADDVCSGEDVEHLFSDGRLKVQPLCYDIDTGEMIPPSVFATPGANSINWIFYFNNNPLIAVRNHPIIKRALANATTSIEIALNNELPEIQSTTGPGNLTKSIFDAITEDASLEEALLVVHDWEDIAVTKWRLCYRADMRNWRFSNQRAYRG